MVAFPALSSFAAPQLHLLSAARNLFSTWPGAAASTRSAPAFGGFLFSGEEGGPFPRGAYSSVRNPKEKTA
jgi:hypothetical protein